MMILLSDDDVSKYDDMMSNKIARFNNLDLQRSTSYIRLITNTVISDIVRKKLL